MSSKALLGDAIRTLSKKASRSLAARKKSQSDSREIHDQDGHSPGQGPLHLDTHTIEPASISAPGTCSTTADPVSGDKDDPTRSAVASLPADSSDTALVPTSFNGSGMPVTDGDLLDLATASFPPVPEDADFPPLPKPVVIPRLNPGGEIPFGRAWAPDLADHAVTKEDFVTFIDNLNIIITPHVAFRVVAFAGFAVGLVPYDVAEGVGGALEVVAAVGGVAMNYKRTRGYLDLMNERYFHPRRLHVKIAGTRRLKRLFGLDKKDACLAPLTAETLELTSQERCLRYLAPHIGRLSFDVPAPGPATTLLARLATWEIRHKVRKADKAAVWGRKRSWKRHQQGKNPQTRWNSLGERSRIKGLDWILVQDLDEWKTQRAEKEARKAAKKRESRLAPIWRKHHLGHSS